MKPIHLLKLHGSLGWYECPTNGIRRGGFDTEPPAGTKRLMVPPQRRKAADTMFPPYSALWSAFRGCLAHDDAPINRLVCIGYGFADEHVNVVIEAALSCNHAHVRRTQANQAESVTYWHTRFEFNGPRGSSRGV